MITRWLLPSVPLVLLAAAVGWLGRPLGVAPTPVDAPLRANTAPIVILGNSTARAAIDQDALMAAVGARVLMVTRPASVAATWHLALADQIFGSGHRPELVVFAAPTSAMLATSDQGPILSLATRADPALDARLFGTWEVERTWNRFRSRARALQPSLLVPYRDTVVGWLSPGEGPARERGAALMEEALGVGGGGGALGTTARAAPEDSFVPDSVALAERYGARLVYVALPVRDAVADAGNVASDKALVEWLNEHRVPFVDLRNVGLEGSDFRDAIHVSTEGRARLSDALAAALVALPAPPDFVPAAPPRSPVRIELEGAPPALRVDRRVGFPRGCDVVVSPSVGALPATPPEELSTAPWPLEVRSGWKTLRRALPDDPPCAGTWREAPGGAIQVSLRSPELAPVLTVRGPTSTPVSNPNAPGLTAFTPRRSEALTYWVAPGTTLRATFPADWAVPGEVVELRTSALVLGDGLVALAVAGDPVATTSDAWVERATVTLEAPEGGFDVTWSSPPDGPWTIVRDLRVHTPTGVVTVLGSGSRVGPDADLLAGKVTFAGPAPTVGHGPPSWNEERGVSRVPIGGEGWLPLGEVLAASPDDGEACSPSVVTVLGEEVDAVQAPGLAVIPGQVAGSVVWVGLDPERRCRRTRDGSVEPGSRLAAARWVYPGDRVRLAYGELTGLHASVTALRVDGYTVRGASLGLELRVGGAVFQRFTVPAAELYEGPLTLPLDRPIPPDAGPVAVVASAGDGFALLLQLALVE